MNYEYYGVKQNGEKMNEQFTSKSTRYSKVRKVAIELIAKKYGKSVFPLKSFGINKI